MLSWLVGSAADCDIVVDSPLVSLRHCLLRRTPEGWRIDDLNSSNGTFVNGRRVELQAVFNAADLISVSASIPLRLPDAGPRHTRGALTIGRAADNDVVFDFPMVSQRHALIRSTESGVKIEDLKSTNGLYLGERRDRVASAVLNAADVVHLGSFKCPAERLMAMLHAGDRGALPQIDFGDRRELLIGRDPQCDVVLNFPMVSWHHARITRDARGLLVHDLRSSNGTYVNGRRVQGPTIVNPGDTLALGSYTFALTQAGALRQTTPRGDISLNADQICVDVPKKRLLQSVSLTILPSEFVGLMGLSGAGKSTLISALNGYKQPSEGRVLLNGLDLYKHFDQFRGHLGYVPQDDIIHADLTVGEALFYSARLRLPADFTDAEIHRRILTVLDQLAMRGTENVLIGSQDRKGISGGQRKRVNLAMELMTDPSVLFLDEPTSGLSSEDALVVMRLLRRLADDGKTILLTIHQPSLEVYRLLDHLVVMAQDAQSNHVGRMAYFGPAYPDAIDFFRDVPVAPNVPRSPDGLLRGMSAKPTALWIAKYESSEYFRQFVAQRAAPAAQVDSHPNPKVTRTRGFSPWWTLVRRATSIKLRDHWNSAVLMIQAPVIAGLICLVFGKKAAQEVTAESWPEVARAASTTLFLTVLSAVWFGCSNAAREIIGEWPVFRRERMVNLGLGSYVGSKFAVLLVLCIIQCAVLLGIVHAYCGLQGAWWQTYATMLLAAGVGVGIGLAISALAKSSEMAIACLPLVILPMVILGGTLQTLPEMSSVTRKLAVLMPSRWAFEAALLTESKVRPRWTPPQLVPLGLPTAAELGDGPEARDMAEEFFPNKTHRRGIAAAIAALGVMFAASIGAVAGLLRMRDTH